MKKALYLFLIVFAAINLNFLCPIFYQTLEGYADIPSGPITLQEFLDFNPNNVKDLKNNGMSDMNFTSMNIFVKRQFDSTFTYAEQVYEWEEEKMTSCLDSISKELDLGDSILLNIEFYKTKDRISEEFYYLGEYFETFQKYVVKTETIASLMRKGSSFISTYPNPATQEFVLQCDAPELVKGSYFILDNVGRKVQEHNIADIRVATPIKMEGYTPGAYILYLVIDGEFFTKKIIKS